MRGDRRGCARRAGGAIVRVLVCVGRVRLLRECGRGVRSRRTTRRRSSGEGVWSGTGSSSASTKLHEHAKRLAARDRVGGRARRRRKLGTPRPRVSRAVWHCDGPSDFHCGARARATACREIRVRRRPQRSDECVLDRVIRRRAADQLACEVAEPFGMRQQGGEVVGGHLRGLCRRWGVRCRNRATASGTGE